MWLLLFLFRACYFLKIPLGNFRTSWSSCSLYVSSFSCLFITYALSPIFDFLLYRCRQKTHFWSSEPSGSFNPWETTLVSHKKEGFHPRCHHVDFEKIPATNLLALRACLLAKVCFSISLLWQQRWRYRHWQDRNRSRVWLSFINDRSRLPFAMVLHGAAYLLFRKSPIGHSTRLINKQQWSNGIEYIKNVFTS